MFCYRESLEIISVGYRGWPTLHEKHNIYILKQVCIYVLLFIYEDRINFVS